MDGGADDDFLYGGDGWDHIYGGEGHDILSGDDGNDHLYGGDGDDILSGGDGDDELTGGAGSNFVDGGDGIDTVNYENEDGFGHSFGVHVDLGARLTTTSPQIGSPAALEDHLNSIENVIGIAIF